MVWSDIAGVSVGLDDPTSQQNDLLREVSNKVDVLCAQKIFPKERVNVRTWDCGNIAAGAGEVHCEWFLVVASVAVQEDIAKGGGAGLG